jgi:hypothetical protein
MPALDNFNPTYQVNTELGYGVFQDNPPMTFAQWREDQQAMRQAFQQAEQQSQQQQ